MAIADDCILGNGALHDRFLLATEILTALVSSAPCPLSFAQLESDTGHPLTALEQSCAGLLGTQMIQEHADMPGHWVLACDPARVTLEDVFRCVLVQQASPRRLFAVRRRNPQRRYHDVDLLITQATIAINQSVFQHLRQFPLERLKISLVHDADHEMLPGQEERTLPGRQRRDGRPMSLASNGISTAAPA